VANRLPDSGQGTRVLTGARALVIHNGDVIGFCSGINASEEVMYEPVDTLDSLPTREHAPVGYRVTLSAQVFRTVGHSVGVSTTDKPGSLKEQQLFPRLEQILRLDGVELMIQDRNTGKTIALFTGVKAQSYNFSITARGIVGQNLQFVAIRMLDESEIV
jgi:hypothetical protein